MGIDAPRVSRMQRRTALKLGVAATVAAGMATGALPGSGARPAFAAASAGQIEPGAGSWKTWVLTSGSELRLLPPPDSASEVGDVRAQAAQRDTRAIDRIEYWDMGAPATRWNEIAITEGLRARMTLRTYRMMALVNVAMADATIAAWDSKYAHNRPRPAEVDPSIATAVATPRSPAYPCEHAVTAGAASTVLAYLFPDQASRCADLAQDAGSSRVRAGVQFPSDVAAGLELGRAVGAKVVEYAKADRTDATWTGTVPEGPGLWRGTNPAEPLAGSWKPWVLSSGNQFRPGPPPAHDSEQKLAELAEIRQFQETRIASPVAFYWARDPVGRPYEGSAPVSIGQAAFRWAVLNHLLWGEQIGDKVLQYRLDANPPRVARAYALVAAAGYDGAIACWDAKYTYWAARPIHLDPTLQVLFPTPAHPTYPSGHSTVAGATETVLGYLFPRDAECFRRDAEELASSREWAGIHFKSDDQGGLALGRAVGQAVIDRARSDGAG